MKDICKGCSLGLLAHIQCAFIAAREEEMCPCTECLVKSMCKQSCQVRNEIRAVIFGLNNPYKGKIK